MKIDTDFLPTDLAAECLAVMLIEDRFNYTFDPFFAKDTNFIPEKVKDLIDIESIGANIIFEDNYNNLQVIVCFDSDTTLIIIENDKIYINYDAKKTYGWNRIEN